MPLAPGTRLGAYEIGGLLGEGGMGQVYRATDTNLARQVAIKVLPESVAADPERLARFDREAKTLAALNHPNIAHIYGLERLRPLRAEDKEIRGEVSASVRAGGGAPAPGEDDDALTALIMELVEGEDLSQRIAQGAMPVSEALPIAKQIAEALEAAHEQGIVHRDLKPANVKVRPDGTVKVLDFGLAKAMEPAGSIASSVSMSPTITTPAMTAAGMILGTAAYMSPEQARGKIVDRRTDIWAFGCVLYEMLTGRRPFEGEDVSLTMAAVMTATPDFSRLPPELPPSLGTYLRRALEKDPRQRVQAIGDFRLALDGAFDAPGGAPTVVVPPRRRASLPWLVAAAAIVLAVASFVWPTGPDEGVSVAQRPVRRFTIDLGDLTLPRGQGANLAIAGESLVFVANHGGVRRLYWHRLDGFETTEIPGTEGAVRPFLSPDGQSVAFVETLSRTIKRAPVAGGDSFVVCTPCDAGNWGGDGRLVIDANSRFALVPERGGDPEVVAEPMPDKGVPAMMNPVLLPGGRAILFEIGRFQFGGVGVVSLDTHDVLIVTKNGSAPIYAPTGHILFGRDDTLFAVPIDLDHLELTGPIVPVLPGVRIENGGSIQAAVSDSGTLVYVPSDDQVGTDLVWVEDSGQVESVVDAGRAFRAPRISPDGASIAVQISEGGSSDIWIHEAGTLRPLTTSGHASAPIWTPDGKAITYAAESGGSHEIRTIPLDGSSDATTLVSSDQPIVPEGWLPDGSRLLVQEGAARTGLYLVDPQNPASKQPYLVADYTVDSAAISPSGTWLAYVSDQTGQREVYVRPLTRPGREQLVSTGGGNSPSWGGSDEELLYESFGGDTVFRASLRFEPLRVARQTLFTSNEYWTALQTVDYDVHPGSGRLLMLRQHGGSSQLRVVENWFSELRERAGK